MLTIYSPSGKTQRLDYIARHIFHEVSGIDYLIIRDKKTFLQQTGACINYSNENLCHGLQIIPHGLLFEKGVREIQVTDMSEWKGYCCFFLQTQGDIPFDLFAASFYLLTLYEEYFPKRLDEHGRFSHKDSLAFRNGFLEIPIIDRWAYLLKEEIEKRYPDTKFVKRKFRFISTFDIDHPYLYLKKGFLKSMGGTLRDLLNRQLENIASRFAVLSQKRPDPYMEALQWIDRIHKEAGKSYCLFPLMKDGGKYGRKTLYPLSSYYRYLKNLDSATIGLHPSYDTYYNIKQLIKEKKRLEKALGKREVTISRQHFLRMIVPKTFRDLEAADFREDFTVAFAHAPGFRSGTAVPHYFYNVELERISKLLLHPTIMMDTCLITYLGLCPEDALKEIKRLIDECKQSGGDFVSLWHNSNLTENVDNNLWLDVFVKAFNYAISIENNTFVSE
jgi:hypothetical protein